MRIASAILGVVGVLVLVVSVVLFRQVAVKRRPVARVCVPGVVVRHVGLYSPPRLEFEYPAPDGSRLRAVGSIALSLGGTRQQFGGLGAGTEIPVYVDPTNPVDAVLTPGASGGNGWVLGAVVALAFGIVMTGFGALMLALTSIG